MIIELVGKSL